MNRKLVTRLYSHDPSTGTRSKLRRRGLPSSQSDDRYRDRLMVHICPTCGHKIKGRDLSVDLDTNIMNVDGRAVHLKPMLAELLYILSERMPRGLSKWDLAQRLYGYRWDEAPPKGVEIHICRARKMLQDTRYEIPRYERKYRIVARVV